MVCMQQLLHANHAALCGHLNIRTVGTDAVVLAVSVAETLGPEYELWLTFETFLILGSRQNIHWARPKNCASTSYVPRDIGLDVMQVVERFVILLYDRTSTCAGIEKARRKLFAKKTNVKLIPQLWNSNPPGRSHMGWHLHLFIATRFLLACVFSELVILLRLFLVSISSCSMMSDSLILVMVKASLAPFPLPQPYCMRHAFTVSPPIGSSWIHPCGANHC